MLSTEMTDAIELMFETGWTDGLPVVPPSEELVRRFVAHTGRSGDELVAELPPLGGRATVERIAVNAVMAGCLPEHMPVVITALEAMMDERFNLRGVMCSTGIHTPLLIVNGPVVQELDINGGYNCFGAGWRANATIGRAVKLALVNLGGAIPGETNKATFGHPGAYTYCVAEDEPANPWQPMHVEMGYAATDSTVTVFPAEAPHNIMYHASNSRDFLTVLADTMCTLGNVQMYVMGDTFVAIGPEHAKFLHADGWNKRDIRQFLFEHARKPVSKLKHGGPPQGDARARPLLAPLHQRGRRRPDGAGGARSRSHPHFRRRWCRRAALGLSAWLGLPRRNLQDRRYLGSAVPVEKEQRWKVMTVTNVEERLRLMGLMSRSIPTPPTAGGRPRDWTPCTGRWVASWATARPTPACSWATSASCWTGTSSWETHWRWTSTSTPALPPTISSRSWRRVATSW